MHSGVCCCCITCSPCKQGRLVFPVACLARHLPQATVLRGLREEKSLCVFLLIYIGEKKENSDPFLEQQYYYQSVKILSYSKFYLSKSKYYQQDILKLSKVLILSMSLFYMMFLDELLLLHVAFHCYTVDVHG